MRFAFEALQPLRALRQDIRQEFQGDHARELGVLGRINYSHPPTANEADDSETPRDHLARRKCALAYFRRSGSNEVLGRAPLQETSCLFMMF